MLAEEKSLQNGDIIDTIEIPQIIFRLRRDGIAHVTFKKGAVLDLDLQKKMLDINAKITGGKKTNFIFDAEENVIITKEARDYAITIEDLTVTKATAVVANNLAYRIIANFYLKFNKPKTHFKVVDTFENGIAWLKTLPT